MGGCRYSFSNNMTTRFLVLDSFRGLAAICVVIYHMHFVGTITEGAFFRGSFVFVDFFFVLSGFVLAHGYGFREQLSFPSFFKRRFLRLYPLHFVMLIGFIAFELMRWILAVQFDVGFNSAPFSGSQEIREIIPNLLLLQAWIPSANSFSFNAPAWSISVEFYLYLALFATLLTGAKIKPLIWSLLAITAAYFTLNDDVWEDQLGLSNEVLRGLLGFFGGVLVYFLYRQLNLQQRFSVFRNQANSNVSKNLFTLLEVGLLALIVFKVSYQANHGDLTLIGLFCLTVLVFSYELGWVSSALTAPFFQYLGKLSYSIYLTHSLILLCINSSMIGLQVLLEGTSFTFVQASQRHFDSGSIAINYILMLLVLAFIVWVSNITYHQIERRWCK